MRIEVLQARKNMTPDLEARMDKLIHPEIGVTRMARTRFHALAVMFYIDAMEDLRQLSEIAQDHGVRQQIGPSLGGYWELTDQEQRWFRLAQAGAALGIGMRALERIIYERRYNPLQIREWYNDPLKGTIIRRIPIEWTSESDREAFIKSTVVSGEVWETMKREHQKDETGASMFDGGFEKLPGDLKSFITSLGVMKELRQDTLPAFRRITAEEPHASTPVPEVFLNALKNSQA